jgi:glutathione S-transferase
LNLQAIPYFQEKIIMLTLYQFPISHYCEKVRWALDYKRLDYRTVNLLPGLHMAKATKLSGSSSLPVLVHDGKIIKNSSDIVDYLDAHFPESPLTPDNQALRQEAMEWEKFADEQIGIMVRAVCYHVLLDHPDMLIPIFTNGGPWYGRFVMPFIYPKLSSAMRNKMKLNQSTSQTALEQLDRAIDKLDAHLQNRKFLVGDCFTRADLAVASLLAPLCKAEKYGVDWPKQFPEPLEKISESYSGKTAWVKRLYADYR